MATAPITTKRLSAEQFAEQYEDVPWVELERGEVVHLSPGASGHGLISNNIASLLTLWARKTRMGRVMTNELGVITARDPDTVRGVDVVYLSYARVPKGQLYDGFCTIAPELAVEVIGKGQSWRKMVEKSGEYLRMGVARVWIVDPKKRTVHVFGADSSPQELSESATLEDYGLLPGFSCRVAEFFED